MNKALLSALMVLCMCSASSCKLYQKISGRRAGVAVSDSTLVTVRDSVLSTVDTVVLIRDNAGEPAPLPRADSGLLQALLPLWNTQTTWNTFNGKAKLSYEGKGESQDFSATIRMEKGKGVWVSVIALGLFEAARVLITPDSIRILNRIQKEVTAMPFSESSKLLPIRADFASLQSLLIGDVLQTGHQPTEAADTALALILSYVSPDFTQSLQFDRKDTSLRLQAVSAPGTFMLSEYSEYGISSGRRFASNRNISMNDKGDLYQLSLEFSKAAFDEAVEMPFSIPENYARK